MFELLPEALLRDSHRSQFGGWPYVGDAGSKFQYPSTNVRLQTVSAGYYDQQTGSHGLLPCILGLQFDLSSVDSLFAGRWGIEDRGYEPTGSNAPFRIVD